MIVAAVASVRVLVDGVELVMVVLAIVLVLRGTNGVDTLLDTIRLVNRTSEVMVKSRLRAVSRAYIL